MALSPVTTYKKATQTASARGTIATIARQDQLCRVLSSRLGIADFCGKDLRTSLSQNRSNFAKLSSTYPKDAYARSSNRLNQVSSPGLVSRIGLENMCSWMAEEVVDNGQQTVFSSTNPDQALDLVTTRLLGLSLDQNKDVRELFGRHFADALAVTQSKTQALKSAVTLACLSPLGSSIGL